jgi:hypothetical protein
MQPACMFMGSTVHKAIEWALKAGEYTKVLPSLEAVVQKMVELFDQGMKDSKSRAWEARPKHHANILEHYYQYPFAEQETLKEKAVLCVKNWYESPCIKTLALHPKALWMGIEANQTFFVEPGVEAIVVYDFYVRWKKSSGHDTLIIFDWKTGSESKKIDQQLIAYALAAMTLFSVPLDSVIVSPFYLSQGPAAYKKYGVGQEASIGEVDVEDAKNRIVKSAKKMLELHPPKGEDGVYGTPDPSSFSYCEDRRSCRRCQFYEICQAAEFEDKPLEALRALSVGRNCGA